MKKIQALLGSFAFLVTVVAVHADEGPVAVHLFAVEGELEIALFQALVDVDERLPGALIPDHDGASAVLAFGDGSFEAAVFDGVVFDLDGEALVGGVVAGAFGDGPAFEDAAPAEALLQDAEGERLAGGATLAGAATGFGSHGEVAHGAVAGELAVDLFRRGGAGGCGFGGAFGHQRVGVNWVRLGCQKAG